MKHDDAVAGALLMNNETRILSWSLMVPCACGTSRLVSRSDRS